MDHALPDQADEPSLPAPWTCADPSTFAWTVLHERHPVLVRTVAEAHPYGPHQLRALDRLLEESTSGVLRPLPDDRHDAEAWRNWTAGHTGMRWDAAPFLLAESYFYRRLLDAIDFFAPGPWFWIDPFAHQKDAELGDPALTDELSGLDRLRDLDQDERLRQLLHASLWGNRADLGFAAHRETTDVRHQPGDGALVADDTTSTISVLRSGPGHVCLVADNAGRELLADLVLIDELISTTGVDSVNVHVKPTPYYVSDATTADVAACLRRLARAGGEAARIAERIRQAFADGRLTVTTHWFNTAPCAYAAMPPDLEAALAAAGLVIFKGDLNYRRVFGDRHWSPSTPCAVAGSYFPSPFVVLRTLKSDVLVGADERITTTLETREPGWRTSGTYALLQHVVP